MTRRIRFLDRTATLLLGALLVAGGLLVLDWRYRVVGTGWTDTVSTGPVDIALDPTWVAWAVGAGGVVLALLGLWWLLAHARRAGSSTRRLDASAAAGRVEVDLRALAGAVADRAVAQGPLDHARGTTSRLRGRDVVEVRARLTEGADTDQLVRTADQAVTEVAAAFPGEAITCRVLVDAPRRPRTGRRTTVRVQ